MTKTAADSLDNMILPDGWVVVGRAPKSPGSTGSFFSIGYIVESSTTGKRAFLKALDLSRILDQASDPLAALDAALGVYRFERDLCDRCRHMDRVVTVLGSGDVRTDPANPLSIVPYLIFEEASGDVRAILKASADLEVAWALRCLHHTATGLQQLHAVDIAHQDIKPSNVLIFGINVSKIADLGRASERSSPGPHDDHQAAGAIVYAPPELLYGQIATEFGERRMACDVYLLGSMLAFFFTGVSMTALLMQHVPIDAQPKILNGAWAGDYAAVLPIVQKAFGKALKDFESSVPESLRAELVDLLRQLCDPDPKRRGNPNARGRRHGNPFDVQFFVSRFNALAIRTEARVRLRSA